LSLRHCKRVRDVSALGRVHSLNLSGCEEIDDVSALARVHVLNLSDCKRLRDVSMLKGVRILDLRYNDRSSSNSDAREAEQKSKLHGITELQQFVPIIKL
ncbi:hypothetical protein Gpo141_00006657, partial [Globisporangium polare]